MGHRRCHRPNPRPCRKRIPHSGRRFGLRCSAANFKVPAQPVEIVVLAPTGLEHLESATKYASEVVVFTAKLEEVEGRSGASEGNSTELATLKTLLDAAKAGEQKAKTEKNAVIQRLAEIETQKALLSQEI